jgi:dihydrofolate reductase
MSKLIWHITMSVDGFIAGEDDDMTWIRGHSDAMPSLAEAVLADTGAILGGRSWYDGALAHHNGLAGVYGGLWSGPVLVLSHRPDPDDADVEFIDGPIDRAIARAREVSSGKDVVLFGANVAQQALAAELLDEIVIHLAPVLLGAGVRLIDTLDERIPLTLTEEARTGQLVDLRYRVGPLATGAAAS